MEEIIRYSAIQPEMLLEEDYFRTLLGAAMATDAMTQAEMSHLAEQFLFLLAEEAERFTQGTSTSLPQEQVDGLYASICYTLSLALMQMPPDDAVELLRSERLKRIFLRGRSVLDRKTRAVVRFLPILRASRIDVPHLPYQFAVMQSAREFFRRYDGDFAAHSRAWIPMYTPVLPLTRAGGILYLQAYLDALYLENRICRAAPAGFFARYTVEKPRAEVEWEGSVFEDRNLCACLLGTLARGTDAEKVILHLGLRGRTADYARRCLQILRCEKG